MMFLEAPCRRQRTRRALLHPDGDLVEALQNDGHEGVERLVDQREEEALGVLVAEIESEAVLELLQFHLGVLREVLDAGVLHERHQVEQQGRVLPQRRVRLAALGLELLRVVRIVGVAHRLGHLLGQSEGRRVRLGVLAEDEAKVDVEEAAVGAHHDVVEVPVADAEEVRDDAIPRARPRKVVARAARDAVGRRGVGVVLAEKVDDRAAVVGEDRRDRVRGLDELDETRRGARRERAEARQLEIEVDALEQEVHEQDELEHELVLAQVVAVLDDDAVRRRARHHRRRPARRRENHRRRPLGGPRIVVVVVVVQVDDALVGGGMPTPPPTTSRRRRGGPANVDQRQPYAEERSPDARHVADDGRIVGARLGRAEARADAAVNEQDARRDADERGHRVPAEQSEAPQKRDRVARAQRHDRQPDPRRRRRPGLSCRDVGLVVVVAASPHRSELSVESARVRSEDGERRRARGEGEAVPEAPARRDRGPERGRQGDKAAQRSRRVRRGVARRRGHRRRDALASPRPRRCCCCCCCSRG
mmetsp:Transcript_15936/g.64259  ORF Transcript_15936/g.64259 Transcript_15936/m.64259 type:complete len:534 (-) Transcript_15936:632-2233(-)